MEKLEKYRTYIKQVISKYGQIKPAVGEVEVEIIFDEVRDHYLLYRTGWNEHRRIHGCAMHINIKNNKIWIEHDGTEDGIATEFDEFGVPKEDIVLAYHLPFSRKFTEYAVA